MARRQRLVWVCGILAATSIIAAADPLTGDPDILIEAGDFSSSFTGSVTVSPGAGAVCGVGGVDRCFDYVNNTGSTITQFTFSLDIGSLTPFEQSLFQCTSGGPFFDSCHTSYDGEFLSYLYSGAHPEIGLSEPCDTEIGEAVKEGIPVAGLCTIEGNKVGHFFFEFQGWTGTTSGGVNLANVAVTGSSVPEPIAWPVLGAALLAIGGLARRKARRA